ncbi:MAG: DUF1989 domain-containing protein [Halioglobus sp.]
MQSMSTNIIYDFTIPAAGHWSLRVRRGVSVRLTDVDGGANLGALFFNPENLLERYNAPDTLKCQHTFKLTRGNCLYSDMGRIFCSIVADDLGWHETVCGNITADHVARKWGARSYQEDRNAWMQNGHDSFLVEMAKYGLGIRDMPANVNLFSRADSDETGALSLCEGHSAAGATVTLRFEMDTILMLHTCPHPLSNSATYPFKPVRCEFFIADAVQDNDYCLNLCPENRRGFENNRLYYLGTEPASVGVVA